MSRFPPRTQCEERVLSDLLWTRQITARADRALRTGNRAAARTEYARAHELLRRAFGTTRGCLVQDKVSDARQLLRRMVEAADAFEDLERRLEG